MMPFSVNGRIIQSELSFTFHGTRSGRTATPLFDATVSTMMAVNPNCRIDGNKTFRYRAIG